MYKIAGHFRESYIVRYFKGNQQHNESIRISVVKRQEEKKQIPVQNFRQMMKDGMIPDNEEYAKINEIDKRINIVKSKDEALEAKWKTETSLNRYARVSDIWSTVLSW